MGLSMSMNAPAKAHTHKEILVILGGLMTGLLLAALDQTIVSTALKSIVEEFNGLNHYIGMKAIIPESIPELRFMPMVIGGLVAVVVLFVAAMLYVRWRARELRALSKGWR